MVWFWQLRMEIIFEISSRDGGFVDFGLDGYMDGLKHRIIWLREQVLDKKQGHGTLRPTVI